MIIKIKTQYEIEQRIISLKEDIDDYKIMLVEADTATSIKVVFDIILKDEIEMAILKWVLKNE